MELEVGNLVELEMTSGTQRAGINDESGHHIPVRTEEVKMEK